MPDNKQSDKKIEILLVEDNEGDIFLTKKVFEKAPLKNNLTIMRDGEEAINYLQGSQDTPDLILLDINLPKKDGKQVLDEIKCDAKLKSIPVIILTSSKAEKDVLESYNLHANSYIVKPVTLDNFNNVVSLLDQFWFGAATLPTRVR